MKRLFPALVAFAFLPLLLPANLTAGGSELLVNGGFESGTAGWSWSDGTLTSVASPVHGGSASGRLAAAGQQNTTVAVHQSTEIVGGQSYEFGGWILTNDPDVLRVELRINWFAAGGLIGSEASISSLTDVVPSFRYITTKMVTAPLAARSATVRVHAVPIGDFEIYLDDFSFVGPAPTPAPTETSTPPATAPATPVPTTPPPVVTPPPQLATKTPVASVAPTPTTPPSPMEPTPLAATSGPEPLPPPAPTPAIAPNPTVLPNPPVAPPVQGPPTIMPTLPAGATPTSTPILDPSVTPAIEPLVFAELTNGGFEATRSDGTPYGWRKFGGSYGSTNSRSLDGRLSLQFTSSTESTKWVYQTVEVVGGAYYEASVYAVKDAIGVEGLFLRVSFYASDDGSGRAISSVDSVETLTNDSPGFRILTTGTVQAPPEARTAKVRLMMRPSSSDSAVSYFDAVSFRRASAPSSVATPTDGPEVTIVPAATTPQTDAEVHRPSDQAQGSATTNPSPAVLGVERTPMKFANVGPPQADANPGQSESSGRGYNLLLILAVTLPTIGLGAIGLSELRRNRASED